MKEKLRKLDGKPTEPGSYRYTEDGWSGDAILAVFYSACNRLYADNDSGVAGWVDELPGQWSELIPECDWEGEGEWPAGFPNGYCVHCGQGEMACRCAEFAERSVLKKEKQDDE